MCTRQKQKPLKGKDWWFWFRWERKRLFAKLNKELVFLQAKINLLHHMSTEQSTYSGDILEDAHLAQHYGTANPNGNIVKQL